jgi:hypothetical protein
MESHKSYFLVLKMILVALTLGTSRAWVNHVVPSTFFWNVTRSRLITFRTAGWHSRKYYLRQPIDPRLGSNDYSTSSSLNARPKRGSIVETYQTVSVSCAKCRQRLFRYKKKNGTKSNLIKCYIERIAEDSCKILQTQEESGIALQDYEDWMCPNCQTQFARSATIKGLPALKLVGGKARMTKK